MSNEENQTPEVKTQEVQTPVETQIADVVPEVITSTPEVVSQGVQEAASEPVAVQAPPVVAPKAKPTAAVVSQTKAKEIEAVSADPFDPMSIPGVAKALKSVPEAYALPIRGLKDYFKEMAPGQPVDPVRGGVLSTQLLKAIVNTINRNEEHFQSMFTAILKLFEAHAQSEGTLSEAYVFRFVPFMQASDDDRRAFTQLVNMLTVLAPTQGRKEAMKQVDIPRSLRYSLTDAGRDRVLNYFGV